MKNHTLVIPVRTSENFGDPVRYLLQFLEEINEGNDRYVFDFSKVLFLSPITISGASIIRKHLLNSGKEVEIILPNNKSIVDYLGVMGFPSGIEFDNEESIDEKFNHFTNKSYVPLVSFPTGTNKELNKIREKTLTALDNLLKQQLGLKGEMFMAINYMLAELTQNVVDHSGEQSGFVFAQYFPSKNFLEICIADAGQGIMQTYIKSDKFKPENHSEAMKFAIYGKSTKDQAVSRGYGLSTSRKMLVEGLKGKFFLMSGNSFFIQTVEREEIITLPIKMNYQGCFVALRIPLILDKNFNFYNFME